MMETAYVILDTSDPDTIPTPRVFSTRAKAIKAFTALMSGSRYTDEEGNAMTKLAIANWLEEADIQAWDEEGRVCYTLATAKVDE